MEGVSGSISQNADWREFEFVNLDSYATGNRMGIITVSTTLNTDQYPASPVVTPQHWVSGGNERYSYDGVDNSLYLTAVPALSSQHNIIFDFTGGNYPSIFSFTGLKVYWDRPDFSGSADEGTWSLKIEDQNGNIHTILASFTLAEANSVETSQHVSLEFSWSFVFDCTNCPTHSSSSSGATSLSDCLCDAAYAYGCTDRLLNGGTWSDTTNDCINYGAFNYCAAYGATDYYNRGAANDMCCACGGGDYSCMACESGKYKGYGMSNDACVACASVLPNSVTAGTGSTFCECAGGYNLVSGTCQACATGFYKNPFGNESCTVCPEAFQTTFATGSNTITQCVCTEGYASTGKSGTAPCVACAPGKYQSKKANDVACTDCSTGGTTLSAAAWSPSLCIPEAGYYQAAENDFEVCAADTHRPYDNQVGADYAITSCIACPEMSSSLAGSTNIGDCTCSHAHVEGLAGNECTCVAGFYEQTAPCSCENSPSTGWMTLSGYERDTTDAQLQVTPVSSCETDAAMASAYQIQHDGTTCYGWPNIALPASPGTSATTFVRCQCPTRPPATQDHTCEPCPADFFCPAGEEIHACPLHATAPVHSTKLSQCQCAAGRHLYTIDPNVGVCLLCPAGTYSENNACSACPDNSNSPEGSTSIDDCTANAGYFRLASSNTISSCPANSYSIDNAFLQSHCLCNAGYTAQDAGTTMRRLLDDFQCVACGNGQYKVEAGPSDCLDCPDYSSHSLTAETSAANCACNAGYTGDADTGAADACSECGTGTYKSVTGSALCTACADANQHSPAGSIDATACVCGAGYYANGGSCVACAVGKYKVYAGNAESDCVDCPTNTAGKASQHVTSTTVSSGQSSPTACKCPAGSASTTSDPATCVLCPHSEYKETISFTACITCPPNSYYYSTGATSFNQCECTRGYSADRVNGGLIVSTLDTACAACTAGTYKNTHGTEPCIGCPLNSYTPVSINEGFEYCECNAGYDDHFTAFNDCQPCNTGFYKDAPGSAACDPCPADSSSPAQSTSIDACHCNAGYDTSDESDSNKCVACINGKYKAVINDGTPCGTCTANSQSELTSASTKCVCSAGFTGLAVDGADCTQCAEGEYKIGTGSAACTACADAQHTSVLPRTLQTDCLCNAGYKGDDTSCAACDNGKYKPTIGTDACTDCPDSYHENTAALDVSECICNAGFEGSAPGCTQCVAGKYSSLQGASRRRLLSVETCGDTYDSYQEPLFEQWVKFDHADNNGIFCRQNNEGDTLLNSFSGASGNCADGPDYWRESIEDSSKDINWCKDRCDNHDAIYSIQCHGFTYRTWTSKGTFFHECQIMLKADIITQAASTSTNARSWSIFTGYTYEVCAFTGCVDCPQYSHSPPGSGDIALCACNTGYTRSDNTCDITCPAGYEGDELSEADACVECGAGKYKSTTGSGACVACPEDSTHHLQGQTLESSCICQQGHIPSATADLYCESCSDGDLKSSFNNFDGETVCYDCHTSTNGLTCSNILVEAVPAGMGVTNENIFECAAGTWNDGLYLTCQDCPTTITNSGPAGATAESDCYCAAGYERINNVCTACRVGAYKQNVGVGLCQDCAAGFTTFATASNLANDCVCAQDFGWDASTCASCDSISTLHFKHIVGNVACIECPENGVYTGAVDSHDVLYCACNPGFKSVLSGKDVSSCIPCTDGSFQDQINKVASCISCGANTVSTGSRTARSDCACATGYMPDPDNNGPDVDGGSCVNSCGPGETFDGSVGAHGACVDCAGGDGSALSVGTFKTTSGTDACTACSNPRNASLPAATAADQCRCMHGTVGFDPDEVLRIAGIGAYTSTQSHSLTDQDFTDTTVLIKSIAITSTNFKATLHRHGAALVVMDCTGNCPATLDLSSFHAVGATISIEGTCTLEVFTHVTLTFAHDPTWLTDALRTEAERMAVQHDLPVGAIIVNTDAPYSTLEHCIECPPGVVCALP